MADKTKTESGSRVGPYVPYGPPTYGVPYGLTRAPGHGLPYVPRPVPYYPYGTPFRAGYSPFGLPDTAESARRQMLAALKAQGRYLENFLNDLWSYVAELESEAEKEE